MGNVLSFIVTSSSEVTKLCDGVVLPNRNTRRVDEKAEQATGSPSAGKLQTVQCDPSAERKISPLVSAGSSTNSVPVHDTLHHIAVADVGSVPSVQDDRLMLVMKPLPLLWTARYKPRLLL